MTDDFRGAWEQTVAMYGEQKAEVDRLREALKFARKRLEYYGTISDRRHFDHDLAEVYPKIDAALSRSP